MELPRQFSANDTVLVNIKRRLQYKHCYETENVRPYKILKALQFLTSHDTLWREAGVRMCPDFVESLDSAVHSENVGAPQLANNESASEDVAYSEDEDLSEHSDDEPPDIHAFGDETMVDDGIVDANIRDSIVNVKPGEGQHPLCLYLDKDAEEMANPDIFGGYARPKNKYSYRQLCRVELRHVNRSVACRPCNIFFNFRKLQVLDMKQLSWMRLRKSKLQGKPLPKAEQLADPEGKRSLMEANIGFRDFKQLRGTSDYDKQGKKEAFAMLRQLGPFTIFYTFSMADMKWPEFI
jgi:hypothetical protein